MTTAGNQISSSAWPLITATPQTTIEAPAATATGVHFECTLAPQSSVIGLYAGFSGRVPWNEATTTNGWAGTQGVALE